MPRENDLVLIYFEDAPLMFARIEEIGADVKPDWYHVRLLMLQIPLQTVTWILRDNYIQGDEFTMNGKRMRLEAVVAPDDSEQRPRESQDAPGDEKSTAPSAKVISLADLKKK